MLKWLKKFIITVLLCVIAFLSAGLVLSQNGETRECLYLWKQDFTINGTSYSAAVYSSNYDGTDLYGLTLAKSEKLEGEILCLPSFLYLSGEKSVVSFGWERGTVLILSVILFLVVIIPKRKKVYELEEEEEAEEETEEEEKEDPYECPNCRERIYEGLEYCENCGINIENFRKKMKKRNR